MEGHNVKHILGVFDWTVIHFYQNLMGKLHGSNIEGPLRVQTIILNYWGRERILGSTGKRQMNICLGWKKDCINSNEATSTIIHKHHQLTTYSYFWLCQYLLLQLPSYIFLFLVFIITTSILHSPFSCTIVCAVHYSIFLNIILAHRKDIKERVWSLYSWGSQSGKEDVSDVAHLHIRRDHLHVVWS